MIARREGLATVRLALQKLSLRWYAGIRPKLHDESLRWAFAVGCGAFLLAAGFVLLVAQPTVNSVDGPMYHRIGYGLAQDFRYNGGAYPYPLYPVFLAVVYVLGGAYGAVFLAHGVLFAITVGLGYWLARRLAGHATGLFAALLIALDATLLGNVGLVATENLQTPLLLLAVVVSLYALRRREYRYHVGMGVLWGLLTLVKPATILWPPFLLPVYLLGSGRLGGRLWLAMALAFVLTLSPWVVRNQLDTQAAATGQFELPFAQGYPTLLIHVVDEGETRHNMAHLEPKLLAAASAAAAEGIERESIQFEFYTLRLLWERIERSPIAYFGHIWGNFTYFWLEPPVVWTDSAYNHVSNFPGGYRDAPGFTYHARLHAALAVLAFLSLILLCRQSLLIASFVALLMFYYAAFHTMYVVLPRFSVPVMPLVLIGAAAFPMLATSAIREIILKRRVIGNALLTIPVAALLAAVAVNSLPPQANGIQQGSFESADQVDTVWYYEDAADQRDVPPVIAPYRARDGFRSAVLRIAADEQGVEKRLIQIVPVWFDATYRLKFVYRFAEEAVRSAPFYVEVSEWDESNEVWETRVKDLLPVVGSRWEEQEYEFSVSASAHTVLVAFGTRIEPSEVLLDNVRLELAVSPLALIQRPYLLDDPAEVNTSNYLPLEKWVETQPQENRSFLLTNPGVARANGWRGDEGTLQSTAYGIGLGMVALWVLIGVLFIRLRLLERMARARLLEVGSGAAMLFLAVGQAATCYLLLFSNPI